MEKGLSIGILGGTFDPVHRGHQAIARSFLDSTLIDELWILLTPSPPHKNRGNITPFPMRMKMLKAAFEGMERIRISDLERTLESPSHTWKTLRHLTRTWPAHSFKLCIGGDSLSQFTYWDNWREIIRMVPLLVADRPSSGTENFPEPLKERTTFVEHEPVAISSSRIRNQLRSGGEADRWLPEKVREIILHHNLYQPL